jgi:Fe-S oxidoreductase
MQIQNVIATTDNCRYCLMCRHVCPVAHVTRLETLTPHGWGLTIASVRRGLVDWDEGTVGVIYKCSDCGACRAHCVTDQPLPDAIAAARAEVVEKGRAPAVVSELEQKIRKWGNPHAAQEPHAVQGQGEVALFVGDEAQYLWPGALSAALKLLGSVGVRPVLIGAGRSNGYLPTSLGLPGLAKSIVQANLSDLKGSGAKRLLVLTPGDFFTFRQLVDDRLGVEWPQDVLLQEVTTFLADELDAGRLRLARSSVNAPYAYLDPTHSVRVTTRYDAPRKLLTAVWSVPGKELFWRRERTHPCGDGALQFTNPPISEQLTMARLEDAAGRGIKIVVTEDPGCLTQLSRYASQAGVSVRSLYELLADALSA